MSGGPVPMSDEVLAHHLDLHPCEADVESARCPCANTLAFFCSACGTVLFAASRDGTWCEHAEALWKAGG